MKPHLHQLRAVRRKRSRLLDLKAVVPVLYCQQQLCPQLITGRIRRQVHLVRACVHVGQVVFVGALVELGKRGAARKNGLERLVSE